MNNNVNDFAKFLAGTKAVKFGDFVLKSGKKSQVFFDFGQLFSGKELIDLGGFFADFIVQHSLHDSDVLFGPAYKGINIAIATSIALSQRHGLSIPFAYNRKITKDHAEGGNFVGCDLTKAKTAILLDDVFTDGGTKYEVFDMLSNFKQLKVRAIVIGVDRQEINEAGEPYLKIFKEKTGMDVYSLATKESVLAYKS
ncbi:MAG: orotate phosphoribosyltransferase [Acidobacteria bacterium]|jgi:orotate phosphoribosyltransferase|nr:orotate phosphoribosyltransferase [Acidobacteriota bacterium]